MSDDPTCTATFFSATLARIEATVQRSGEISHLATNSTRPLRVLSKNFFLIITNTSEVTVGK